MKILAAVLLTLGTIGIAAFLGGLAVYDTRFALISGPELLVVALAALLLLCGGMLAWNKAGEETGSRPKPTG